MAVSTPSMHWGEHLFQAYQLYAISFIRQCQRVFLQLWIPRVELHLFYNTIVFIPMVIAMYYHMFSPVGEEQHAKCTCAWHADEMPDAAAA